MGMCRFEDENDEGYEKFKGVLAKFISKIKSEQGNATKPSLEGDATHRAGQSLSGTWSSSPGLGRCKDADWCLTQQNYCAASIMQNETHESTNYEIWKQRRVPYHGYGRRRPPL